MPKSKSLEKKYAAFKPFGKWKADDGDWAKVETGHLRFFELYVLKIQDGIVFKMVETNNDAGFAECIFSYFNAYFLGNYINNWEKPREQMMEQKRKRNSDI